MKESVNRSYCFVLTNSACKFERRNLWAGSNYLKKKNNAVDAGHA